MGTGPWLNRKLDSLKGYLSKNRASGFGASFFSRKKLEQERRLDLLAQISRLPERRPEGCRFETAKGDIVSRRREILCHRHERCSTSLAAKLQDISTKDILEMQNPPLPDYSPLH